MKTILIVATGSGIGGIVRYGLQQLIYRIYPSSFPFGTFTVNLLGCLLIGIFFGLAEKGNLLSAEMKIFLITGFCGGFTTFSTFSVDNMNLLRSGDLLYFVLYAAGSIFLGLLATYLGLYLIKTI